MKIKFLNVIHEFDGTICIISQDKANCELKISCPSFMLRVEFYNDIMGMLLMDLIHLLDQKNHFSSTNLFRLTGYLVQWIFPSLWQRELR